MGVHDHHGTGLEISFPVQLRNPAAAVLEAMKRIMESDKPPSRQMAV
jgi:hypothetical protein